MLIVHIYEVSGITGTISLELHSLSRPARARHCETIADEMPSESRWTSAILGPRVTGTRVDVRNLKVHSRSSQIS